jgi:hypothetical protein
LSPVYAYTFAAAPTAGAAANVAVTEVSALIVNSHVAPVPLHVPPLQPVNVAPGAAVALSSTLDPLAYVEVVEAQLVPQLSAAGTPTTLPLEVLPALVRFNVRAMPIAKVSGAVLLLRFGSTRPLTVAVGVLTTDPSPEPATTLAVTV